ncbi:Ig-like domain-containing protein, partial [Aliarcobacter cryaerophilus]|uniref:Ig-like domain-containing protein n=1 Tax=Aliarcobacter cryaerophilus TaxID=28198 RepID=UPI003DA58093
KPVTVPAGQSVTVNLTYSKNSGDFTEGDLSTIVKSVTITGGNSSVNFTNTAIIDDKVEGNEVYNVTINSVEQSGAFENVAIHEDKTTTGTIQDNAVRIVLVATDSTGKIPLDGDGKVDLDKNTNQTPEGGKLYYVPVAIDSNGKPLDVQAGTVDLTYGNTSDTNDKDATAGTDYDSTKTTATIGTVFSVDAKDDYYAEGDEKFTVTISNPQTGTGYKSTVSVDTYHNKVTSTIKDNPAKVNQPVTETGNDDPTNGNYGVEDTVYIKITQTPSTVEGGTLTHTVTLVDKNGKPVTVPAGQSVTVNLTYSKNSGDFTEGDLSTIVKSVTITGGKSSENFTNITKDDFTYEGDEVYNVTISSVTQSGAFENVAIGDKDGNYKTTTGTIKDGVTIIDSNGNKIVPENAIVDEDRFDVTKTDSKISNKDSNANKPTNTLDHSGTSLGIQKPNADDGYTLSFGEVEGDNFVKVYKGKPEEGNPNALQDFKYDDNSTALKSGGQVIHYQTIGNKIIGYVGSYVGSGTVAQTNKVLEITLNKDSSLQTGANTNKITKDNYTYTQYKNIDHPVAGASTDSINDDNITFEFGFKIEDQGQTSDVVKFKVTVNDSLPRTEGWIEEVNEDGNLKIVISPENFKDGEIKIRVNGDSDYTTLSNGKTKNVTDPNDSTKVIGILNNNGDGTVTFTPSPDYSNYNVNPWFEYSVSDFDGDTAAARVSINVKPVADAPTIYVKDISTTEDNGNTKEGTNKVDLELKVPYLSKDSDKTYSGEDGYIAKQNSNTTVTTPILTPSGDKNNGETGDNPERNGEITLTFTNGQSLVLKNADGTTIAGTGAKIFIGNETSVSSTINSNNQEIKVVIVTASGGTDIDYNYHHKDVTSSNPSGDNVLYLTKSEYESLKIQHAEDNDTDIKITIKVTSYEVDDSGIPLDKTTYGNQVESTTTADMIVKIQPMTDDIKLEFNDTNVKYFEKKTDGTFVEKTIIGSKTRSDKDTNIDNVEDTFTFTNKISEGSGEINLNSILSNTSGALNGTGGTKGDLDGSEKRTYTITGIPEGTIVKIGDTEAIAGKDGKATLTFKDAENKDPDPSFTMKFPEHFGGGVKATIKLSVYDKGVDSTDTAGAVKTQTVYLNIDVEPVATTPDLNTFQVAQAIGYEDAGRSKGNDLNANANIDQPAKGIPLNIKVSSTDTDGSETANLRISDIPNGSALYVFDKSLNSGAGAYVLVNKDFTSSGNITVTQSDGKYTVEIKDYQNDKAPKFIPPYNDDSDYKLKVSVQFEDTVTYNDNTTITITDPGDWSNTKDIDVIVKNVADAPVGTSLKDTGLININGSSYIKATEDTLFNLKDVYKTPASLASSDNSEELTVKISLKDGFTISNGSPYYIDNGEYVVKASDIIAGKIKIVPPANFSGTTIFDLTYVTTEQAGENDSKTWYTQNVGIFIEPQADDVTVASGSTIYEDGQDKDGNVLNTKIDLKPTLTDTGTTNGTETVEAVYISTDTIDSMIIKDYKLYIDGTELNTTSHVSKTVILEDKTTATKNYYVVNKDLLDKITVKNTVDHKINGDFTLNVAYEVKDTNSGVSDTKIYEHTHTVTVKALTDKPTLGLGTITTTDSSKTTITGTTVTVKSDANADFTIPVTTTSDDKDSSEKVQEIVISGVPKGVSVENADYMGYSGSVHNGIWVIRGTNLTDKDLDNDGASQNIKFVVNPGADFESRPIIITTYTKDEATDGTKVESASQTITIEKSYTSTGPGTGNPPQFDLGTQVATIYEDNDNKDGTLNDDDIYNLGKSITVSNSGGGNAGNWAITITDFPEGTKVEGKNGVNIYTYEQGGKTHYVITGTTITGNVADINTALSNVIVTPPADMNTGGDINGQMTFSATISTSHNGTYHSGTPITDYKNDIIPVTDKMTVSVVANNTNEDTATPITITLSNPSDGTKTALIGNSITIKVSETWKDDATGGVGTKGTLKDPSGKYNVVYNSGDDTYTITPKNSSDNFKVDTPITGLVYTPAANRDGDVKFEVSVKNKEGNSIELTSKGETTIEINPVIDMKPSVTVVTATSTEDLATTISGVTLQNAVKLNVAPKVGETFDSSEEFTNIVLDEVPNGFTVWYKVGSDLVMATNIGQSGTGTFDLTPNISTDALTHRNKWLVPVTNGAMPEIYINAPENWAGDFDFKAQFTLKEQNLTKTEKIVVDVPGQITPVADGVTIDPTLTFGKAFEWIDLKLNANMKDVDGSETMSLELSGLSNGAMFKVGDKVLDVNQAKYENGKWTITGIKYDEINKIEFMNDKTVETVNVKAWTQEIDKDGKPYTTDIKSGSDSKDFKLDIKDVGGILELDKGINLDFSKLETTSLKGINSIDLSKDGKNKLENLKLSDVLSMTNNKGELIIKGDNQDEVSFKKNDGWNKGSTTETIGGKIFDIYSNSGDNSVKVKVEQAITDGITS